MFFFCLEGNRIGVEGQDMKKEMFLGLFVFIVLVVITLLKVEPLERKVDGVPQDEVRAVYVSYIELSKYLDKPSSEEQKEGVATMVQNIANDGFNWILLHTRSFSDSIYPSSIFPSSYLITRDEKEHMKIDVLQEFIEQAHAKNIQVHAWINPYRIRNDEDFSSITEENPAFKWIRTTHVQKIDGKGIFYNPASTEVRKLVLAGVREIIENYDVDGIHFDDYFYPDKTIDFLNYQEYINNGGTLSLEKYRLDNVNQLIRGVYELVHGTNKNIVFGIAPDGNVTNNYQENFADILTWLSEDGYVDYIMPQLYYGFQNETKPFIQTLNDWNSYIRNTNIRLIPALALYKTGNIDEYAKTGKEEWLEHSNIIINQIKVARNMKQYGGFSLFRYDNLYAEQNEIMQHEVEAFRKFFLK